MYTKMLKVNALLVALLLATLITMLGGCPTTLTTDNRQAQKTEIIQDRLNSRLGLPNIVNGQEKRLMKELYELRDQSNLTTFTYTFSELNGQLTFLGKSIGFGIPASVQYSNPEKEVYETIQGGFGSLPQAEPNGLFMPEGLSATWVYLIDSNTGQVVPTYVEPLITVSLFPLANANYPATGPQFGDLDNAE